MSIPDRTVTLKKKQSIKWILVGLILLLLILWLLNTPPGLLGKTDAVGYAVCHRISSHSFYFGERPFSLCARCTGQYLGFLWGFLFQLLRGGKKSGFPSKFGLLGFGIFFFIYLVDGLNSVVHLYPGLEDWSIYQPSNTVRLITGLGMGIVISGILFPLLGQTLWRETDHNPALENIKDWGLLLTGAVVIALLVVSGNPLLIYPLIFMSAGGLITLLTILYGVIWILLGKRENNFQTWEDTAWWGVFGFGSALIQIMVIDLIRFYLTGSWSGFLEY
jgi:uncharacterized membrane protein